MSACLIKCWEGSVSIHCGSSRVLDYFAALGLNLTKIESSPIPEQPFEYRFYLDFVGSLADRATSDLIRSLSREMTGFRLLGNYCED